MGVIIRAIVPPRPISHSTNPFSNGTAYACFCTIQRTRKGNRPEEARHRTVRHWACKQRMDSTSAFYVSRGHASSAEVSLRMPPSGARSRKSCGRRICERLIRVQSQRCGRHTEAVYTEDEHGERRADRNLPLRVGRVTKSGKRRSRNLNVAIDISRLLTRELQGQDRPAYVHSELRERQRKQSQKERSKANVHDREKTAILTCTFVSGDLFSSITTWL